MSDIPEGGSNRKSRIMLVVLIILVLMLVSASIFYVLLEERSSRPCTRAPIGIRLQGTDSKGLAILVLSAPDGALIEGSVISYMHNGTLMDAISAEIYAPDGSLVASYIARNDSGTYDGSWSYSDNYSGTHSWQKGMILEVHVSPVSAGDYLIITSDPYTFGTTAIQVK